MSTYIRILISEQLDPADLADLRSHLQAIADDFCYLNTITNGKKEESKDE